MEFYCKCQQLLSFITAVINYYCGSKTSLRVRYYQKVTTIIKSSLQKKLVHYNFNKKSRNTGDLAGHT
jgi:hypothetical protein